MATTPSSLPSTQWRENIASDEAQRHAAQAQLFARIQAEKSQRHGKGRALHRKQLAAARGSLQVHDALPDFARQGLFAEPGTHEAWVRLSNGGMDRASDRTPDIRGFALRVFGVTGPSALGNGDAVSQDFALINHEKFAFPNSAEFVDFVAAAARGPMALIGHIFKRHGLGGGLARLKDMKATIGKRFTGFATESLWSAVPVANGPYAVRVRLIPHSGNGTPDAAAANDWGADFARRLSQGPLIWDLQLQPFTDERNTPIEDASVDWNSPYTTVARLTLPQQDLNSAAAQAFAQQVESSVFDPWQALAAHRPLGEVQRARKVVYFESQKGRGAA